MSAKLFQLKPCLSYKIATSDVKLEDSTNIEYNKLSKDCLVVLYLLVLMPPSPQKTNARNRQAYADLVQFKRLQCTAVALEQQKLSFWE